MIKPNMKYIFISGGVISGLGKGITTASLAFLLKSRGYKVTTVKVDMYFNVDAGTLRPTEHGEVFVTHDGMECDEDIGHYERFIDEKLRRENYITAGQIYGEIIRKERAFEYEGETVDAIPHVTDEIIRRVKLAGTVNKADVVLIEFGGTVGEYKNGIFFEASRILKFKQPKDVIHLHVTYLPYMPHIGELKSKPAQTSVHVLNSLGIQPDVLVARSSVEIDAKRLEKIGLYCNILPQFVFSNPDLDSVYKLPLHFHNNKKHLASTCLKLLSLPTKKHHDIKRWKQLVASIDAKKEKTVKIAMVGKYFNTGDYKLSDSYVSVVEALKHASWKLNFNLELDWVDCEKYNKKDLSKYDGILVPQGWGKRGIDGKVDAINFARTKNVPYLGLCFGMQMAVIEFARNVLGLKDANTTEANPKTKNPVVHVMPDQQKYLDAHQYGGTIRLGAWPCKIKPGSVLEKIYKKNLITDERHRHRYEFNIDYKEKFEKAGMVFSGTSPDGKLVEAVEIPKNKFFVATQFHPEYISTPLNPHPIFLAFISASAQKKSL
jgi:CTP synthase